MIVVLGSINIDQVYQMEKLPAAGETVLGQMYLQVPGGKGANQALAARRAGAEVAMIGCVGKDGNAEPALSLMKADDVDLSAVTVSEKPTGCASIWVDGNAENSIVVVSGANMDVAADQIVDQLSKASYLVMQMEVPAIENWKAVSAAKKAGVKTILNLAPAAEIPEAVLLDLDYLVVNELEAEFIANRSGFRGLKGEALAAAISEKYALCCVLTLGAAGVIAAAKEGIYIVPSYEVTPVDTTAAGDSFIGGFVVALSEGKSLQEALQFATVTAGLACTVAGAQSSLPYRETIDAALSRL